MISDLPAAQATALIRDLQRFAQLAPQFVGAQTVTSEPPLSLLVFARRKDFARLVDRRHFAAFTQPGLADTLLVIGPSRGGSSLLSNALHEYTHYLLRTRSVGYPVWYEEGLASVLATSRFDPAAGTTKIGRISRDNDGPWTSENHASIRRIVETRNMEGWSGRRMSSFYRDSAELAHFFLFGPLRNFPDYRPGLHAHFADRSADLFTSLGVSEQRLSKQWQRYLAPRTLPVQTLSTVAATGTIASSALTISQTQAWHARAAEIINPEQAAVLYRKLLEREPDNLAWRVDLARVAAEFDVERAARVLAPALANAADDPGVLVQQAALITRRCRLRSDMACLDEWRHAARLLRRALQQDPDRQDAIFQLGITELYTGNPGRAVNYLRIAYNRVPWSPRVNLQLGECLRLLGSSHATRHLAQARDWAYSDWVRKLATAALERIGS